MVEGNICQEFRLRNIEETKNYFIKEIEQNELMSKNHKNVYTALNYTEHFLILASAVTKLNGIEVLNSRAIIDSYISHDELVSVNNVLRKYDDVKKEIKKLKISTGNQRF